MIDCIADTGNRSGRFIVRFGDLTSNQNALSNFGIDLFGFGRRIVWGVLYLNYYNAGEVSFRADTIENFESDFRSWWRENRVRLLAGTPGELTE